MLHSRTSARSRGRHRAARATPPRIARTVGAAGLAVGTTVALTPAAAEAKVPHDLRHRVIDIAQAQHGDPYVYAGDGPDEFDCSGLTQYAFGKIGKYLPHNSSQQVAYTTRVSASERWHGDLVFFYDSSGHVYHVAIYAGKGYITYAPRPGDVVKTRKLTETNVFYGHVQ